MHALTCDILNTGDTAYAMIPTYWKPNKFLAAKVYIAYAWHGVDAIFYHCMVKELLDSNAYLLDVLPTAQVRCIDKFKKQCLLSRFVLRSFSLSKEEMQNDISAWHARYLLDIPAPFVVATEQKLQTLRDDIHNYFKSLAD